MQHIKLNRGVWISGMIIAVLISVLIVSVGDYLIPSKLKAHFAILFSTDYWGSLLINSFLLLTSLMVIEAFVVGWRICSIKRLLQPSRSSRIDIMIFLLEIFRLNSLLQVIFTFGIIFLIYKAFPSLPTLGISQHINNSVIEGVVWLLVRDFALYWVHILLHRVDFLWEAHKFHHSATEFNMLTLTRLHAIEMLFRVIGTGVILALLGIPVTTFPLFALFWTIADRLNHSNLPWRYGWVGRWFLISPHAHRIHHSIEPEHFNKNFGDNLAIWDRLFGTWLEEEKESGLIEIGIPDNVYNKHNFFYDYWLCFFNTMKVLGKRLNIQKIY